MEDPKKNNLRRSNSLFMCTQRAIRVRFFRNGDRYFTGFTYPISFNRYKDFEILLKDLSNSVFCDKSVMPCGVRSIFDLSGSKIRSVHQMEVFKDKFMLISKYIFIVLQSKLNKSNILFIFSRFSNIYFFKLFNQINF